MIFKILHISDIHISSKEDKNHKMLRENLVNLNYSRHYELT